MLGRKVLTRITRDRPSPVTSDGEGCVYLDGGCSRMRLPGREQTTGFSTAGFYAPKGLSIKNSMTPEDRLPKATELG